jgi:hypothetical protein
MRKWTVLVFMAADNDLDHAAVHNIHQMERVGSSDDVALVVQVDRRGDGPGEGALRGLVTKNPHWEQYSDKIASALQPIGETDTGDPSVLTDFIVWGVRTFPAERYALVIWNHGSGWKPEFIYDATEKAAGTEVSTAMRAADFASLFAKQTKRCLFRSTLQRRIGKFIHERLLPNLPASASGSAADGALTDGIARAICLDETSHDALDSVELREIFTRAWPRLEQAGFPSVRFALVGFDACLMAGLEIAYQLRDVASVIVGSEEIEPAAGWRYDLLLESLSRPDAPSAPEACAKAIVDGYMAGLADYKVRLVTQSAVRTSAVPALAERLNDVAAQLLPALDSRYGALAHAEKTATRFFDADYVDLGDYLSKIQGLVDSPEYRAAWEGASAAYRDAVVCSRFGFPKDGQGPTGLSLYYPAKPMFDESYGSLDVSKVVPAWVSLIHKYHFLT